MLNVKGFMVIDSLVSNQENNTSIIGELSAIARTYSREIGEYTTPGIDGYRLYSFDAKDMTTDAHVVIPDDQVQFVVNICKGVYDYARTNIRPYDVEVYKDAIIIQFSTSVADIEFGEMEDADDISLPQWVEFTNIQTGNTYRIWLSDRAFRQQYDLYHIEVIPYLSDLNNLHGFFGDVNAAYRAKPISKFMEDVQARRDDLPETVFHVMEYDIVNQQNTEQKLKFAFGVLVYGIAGDNVDAIKAAIIEYLENNSDFSKEQWENLTPDLFKTAEFTIYPRWDKIGIRNLTELSSIYSSVVSYEELRTFIGLAAGHYEFNHVMSSLEIFPHTYKHVCLMAIPGERNDPAYRSITQIFPDYIAIQNTALDFMRMSENTREWAVFLSDLIRVAEYMTQYNTIPSNYRRISRNDKLYISAVYKDVNYLIAAKSNSFYQR